MEIIKYYLQDNKWIVDFSQHGDAAKLINNLGIAKIVLEQFTSETSSAEVYKHLSALYPSAQIINWN